MLSLRSALLALLWVSCAPRATVPAGPDLGEVVLAWEQALVEGRPRDALIAQAREVARVVRMQRPDERAWVAVGDASYEVVLTRDGWRLVGPGATDPARPAR